MKRIEMNKWYKRMWLPITLFIIWFGLGRYISLHPNRDTGVAFLLMIFCMGAMGASVLYVIIGDGK
jgi:hypothetical protein